MKPSFAGKSGPKVLLALILAMATLAPLFFQTWLTAKSHVFMSDFQAFYCAAKIAKAGENPYHNEPLRSCEFRTAPRSYFVNAHVTIPAPLPGYTLALLMPLATLPIVEAAAVWALILVLAWSVSIIIVVKLTGYDASVGMAAFAFSIGLCAIPLGELAPVTIAAICASAFFARERQWSAASVFAAISMVEPHLGIPTCLALAIWSPKTRGPLAIAAATLAVLSTLAIGASANLEYITSVLPAQALSEAASDAQYSLTAILTSSGINPFSAVGAGSLWYIVMLLLGCCAAGIISKGTDNPAFLVTVPVTFAVFAGTYVHITQISAALPAALLLVRFSECARLRTIAVVSVLLLVVPWGWTSPVFLIAPFFPTAWLARLFWGTRFAIIVALLAMVLIIGITSAVRHSLNEPSPTHYVAPIINPILAQRSWNDFSASHSASKNIAVWVTRIPTWIGLALLIYCILLQSRPREFVRRISIPAA